MRCPRTVTASTMIARLGGCAQGQMSQAHVEKERVRAQPEEIVSVEVRGSHRIIIREGWAHPPVPVRREMALNDLRVRHIREL